MPGNGSLAQRTLFEFSSAKAMAGDVFAGEVGAATQPTAAPTPGKKPGRTLPLSRYSLLHRPRIATLALLYQCPRI
eukprot:scaffold3116_cov101-Isochrysis_galbana.AAC.1